MKSTIDIHQFLLSNQANLKKLNTKNYFFQNKTIDSISKEKKINQKKFIKNQSAKNNFINYKRNQERKSKSKSKSNSLKKEKINKNLLKFPESYHVDNIILTNRSQSSLQLNMKIYEKALDNLFNYMKEILPLKTYQIIEKKFISDIKQLIISINHFNNEKKIDSSITCLIKNSLNNISNISNKDKVLNTIFSPYKNENYKKQKNVSLYSLKKGNKIHYKTANNSRSKSKEGNSLSKIIDNSKIKSSRLSNKKNNNNKKESLMNSKMMLNSKLFQKLKEDYIKLDLSNNSIGNKNQSQKGKIVKMSINNLKTIHNRNINDSNYSGINGIYGSNSQSKKKKSKSINSENKNIIVNEKLKTIESINNENKNSEQLKVIKSSLDDNLKVMFNFSYEGFLNKESESQSKNSETINYQNSNPTNHN